VCQQFAQYVVVAIRHAFAFQVDSRLLSLSARWSVFLSSIRPLPSWFLTSISLKSEAQEGEHWYQGGVMLIADELDHVTFVAKSIEIVVLRALITILRVDSVAQEP
jgi:hypothetical protein